MAPTTVLRVVVDGPTLHMRDFRLRRDEDGLSVFAEVAGVDAETVVDVLRSFGKQGELPVADDQRASLSMLSLDARTYFNDEIAPRLCELAKRVL